MSRRIAVLYLVAVLFAGIGYIAMMPLFEGFDEMGHFSSMRQIADTGTIPHYGINLDKEIDDYLGPRPYRTDTPPFNVGLTYYNFFQQPQLVQRYVTLNREPHQHPGFKNGNEINNEAQHPPLYYLLFAPLEKITDHLSFVSQIFVLRTASFLMAWIGVLIAFRLTLKSGNSEGIIGFLLYPVLFPMFFPEFARMGSDSLCLLLVAVIAWLLVLLLQNEDSRGLALAIGVLLAVGLATKAFFVPITAGIVFYMFLRMWRSKTLRRWPKLLWMLLPPLLAGLWYAYETSHGSGLSGVDTVRFAHNGNVLANLRDHFPAFTIARGMVVAFVTWIWAGTWSFTHLPPIFFFPVLALVVWIVIASLLQLRKRPLTDPVWLPFWLGVAFSIGFLYHIVVSAVAIGNGQTGGWYLHMLMPWSAPVLGMGIFSIWRQLTRWRPLFVGLLAYALLFQLMTLWCQFTLFTGCSFKTSAKTYGFADHNFCLLQTPTLMGRLGVLAWPTWTVFGFGVSLACLVCVLVLTCQREALPEI